ncbi:MAG: MmcQ/YjbR family DNA-binding protein [Bacteroidota bacterium]
MNTEEIRAFCLSLPGTTEGFPFDEVTLVFKVMGKMYCLMNLDGETGVNLKNTPDKIIEMQEQYPFVIPGYHMNKVHWNVVKTGMAPATLLKQWIEESYGLVVKGLTREKKEELKKAYRR